jgi:hypothetical protein
MRLRVVFRLRLGLIRTTANPLRELERQTLASLPQTANGRRGGARQSRSVSGGDLGSAGLVDSR